MNAVPRVLVVADDRHAERELRDALRRAAARGQTPTVLTADALLAMRLRRERIDARLAADCLTPAAIDALDRIALSAIEAALDDPQQRAPHEFPGEGPGRHLEYSLIPLFMRAVRNVGVVGDLTSEEAFGGVIVVGSGPLAAAARHVAAARRIPTHRAGALPWQQLRQTFARLRAGRHVRWVGMEFRSLVLEPGFLLMLYARGAWRRLRRGLPPISRSALVITADRWTAEIVERLGGGRTVILAGATQPGRALFRDDPRLVPIETLATPVDLLTALAAIVAGLPRALSPVKRPDRPGRFTVNNLSFWPLVARGVRLHAIVWAPLLRHLQLLTRRAASAAPDAALLTSSDAPTYASALIAFARECGVPSTTIQHGLMGEPNGHSVVRADTIAAWGPATEQWHLEHAPQTARFVVTGYAQYDSLAARRRAAPKTESAATDRPFTIVVCTSFISDFSVCASESANLTMLEAVIAWAATASAVRVVQKLHPGEEPAYYATAAAALGWNADWFTMTSEPILYDLLESSDVLVTGYSSTVLESVMLGTPAIVCDFVQRHLLPVDRLPGVTVAYAVDDLHRELDRARAGGRPDRDRLADNAELTQYVSTIDGKAAERVAALVQESGQ